MNEVQVRSLEQVRQVVAGTQVLEFRRSERDEGRYAWIASLLRRFGYGRLKRSVRSVAYLVGEMIPRVPVRQWVLSFPIPLRILFAAHPELLTPVLRIIHPIIAGFLLKQAGLKRATADTGAVTLVQRIGSAANLNIHLHCLVLDGAYRRTDGGPVFRQTRCGEHQRKRLERLCRYITRPAIANERPKRDGAGNVVLQRKSPLAQGHQAHRDVAAGIHAAPGGAGAAPAPASDPLSRRAGTPCRAARGDRAGRGAQTK